MAQIAIDETLFWVLYGGAMLLAGLLIWVYLWTGGIVVPLMTAKIKKKICVLRGNLAGAASLVHYKAEDGGLVPCNKKDDARFALSQEDRIMLPNNNPIYLALDVVGYTQPLSYLNNISSLHQMGFHSLKEAQDYYNYAVLESQRESFVGLKQEEAQERAQALLKQGWDDLLNYNVNEKILTFLKQTLNPKYTINLALASKFAASRLNPSFIKAQEERKLSIMRADQNKMTQKELLTYVIIFIVLMAGMVIILKMSGQGTFPSIPGLS